MKAAKVICSAAAVISLITVLCLAGLPYERMIVIPPLATGGIAIVLLILAAVAVTVRGILTVRAESVKKRRVRHIVLTVLADIVLVLGMMTADWLLGGNTVDKVIDSPDGKHRVVLILDSDVLGNPIYRYYAGSSPGIVYRRVTNTIVRDPEIVWDADGVSIAGEYYRF